MFIQRLKHFFIHGIAGTLPVILIQLIPWQYGPDPIMWLTIWWSIGGLYHLVFPYIGISHDDSI